MSKPRAGSGARRGNGADDPVHHVRQIPDSGSLLFLSSPGRPSARSIARSGRPAASEGLAGGYCQADGLPGAFSVRSFRFRYAFTSATVCRCCPASVSQATGLDSQARCTPPPGTPPTSGLFPARRSARLPLKRRANWPVLEIRLRRGRLEPGEAIHEISAASRSARGDLVTPVRFPRFLLRPGQGPGDQEQPGRQHDSNSRFHGFLRPGSRVESC